MPPRLNDPHAEVAMLEADFRVKTTMALAITALLFLTPFSINNFIQGRFYLGVGSLAIVALSASNAWTIKRGRFYPLITLLGVAPAAVVFLAVSIVKQGVIGAFWCYPVVLYFYFTLPERKAWFANGVLVLMVAPMTWFLLERGLALRVAVTLLVVSIFSAIFVRVISRQQRLLESLAVTDSLTGLSNRTLLDTTLETAQQQSRRAGAPMTLISLDLDFFKRINDELGHDAGDNVLRSVGELLRTRTRRADSVFRVGGEEFLMLLYGTDNQNGVEFAEVLRQAVASLDVLPGHKITTSIGVATLRVGEDWRAWVKRSDQCLYIAKSTGRNRVVNVGSRSQTGARELFGLPVV